MPFIKEYAGYYKSRGSSFSEDNLKSTVVYLVARNMPWSSFQAINPAKASRDNCACGHPDGLRSVASQVDYLLAHRVNMPPSNPLMLSLSMISLKY